MIASWEDLAAALETPQGSTIYALLAMALLSAASFWLQNRARPGKLASSLISTLTILTVLRLLEALVGAAAWLGDAAALRTLPALERGLHLVTIFALAWLWLQAHNAPRYRSVFSIGLFVVLAMTALLFALWLGNPAQATFNYTDLDYVWTATCVVALLFAVTEMLRTRQTTGLLLFAVLFVGQALHFMLAEPFGSMPLATQIAHLIALPLLFMLPVTQATAEGQAAESGSAHDFEPDVPVKEEGEFSDLESDQPVAESSIDDLARHTAARLGADICVFANMDEASGKLSLIAGYNLLRGPIEPESIPLNQLPELHAALAGGQTVRVSAEERSSEQSALSQALRLSFQAYLLAAPLQGSLALPHPALLLLSLEHSWQDEDEHNLKALVEDLAAQLHARLGNEYTPAPTAPEPAPVIPEQEVPIIPEQEAPPPVMDEVLDPQTRLEQLEVENENYRQDVERLLAHIDELEAQPGAANGQAMQSHELVQALQMENERLKSSLAMLDEAPKAPVGGAANIDVAQAKEELRLAMEEVARLHAELEAAQLNVLTGEVAGPAAPKMASSQMEVIASVAQELRQPLSSIVGYTDLLLGESVGILGALQRKFLERVRSSTGRMNTLIDNLIRIAELDQGGYSANRKPVELSGVIDDAIGLLRQQFQEKRIAMRVDLPETLPELNTDRDALQQILYHLLQNADAATPAEGSISLRAVVDNQKELGEFVLIQVSDSGGGIPESDLPRVFSRVYRASNPVIPGVGDTGVGLTIAETLTQALGGRIWVESEAGVGATFSVLLPLNQT